MKTKTPQETINFWKTLSRSQLKGVQCNFDDWERIDMLREPIILSPRSIKLFHNDGDSGRITLNKDLTVKITKETP